MLKIPIKVTSPDFSFPIELDGSTWSFRFRWNHRMEQWRMDVFDAEGNALVRSVGVVINTPLLNRFAYMGNLPPGVLLAIDTAQSMTDATYDDFGTRVVLIYFTPDEVAARLGRS